MRTVLRALAVVILLVKPFQALSLAQEPSPSLKNQYDKAFAAMMADLTNPELSFQFVKVAIEVGDLRGAIAALERILLINPSLANIQLELGVLYLRVGNAELAQDYLSQSDSGPWDTRRRAESSRKISSFGRKPVPAAGSVSASYLWLGDEHFLATYGGSINFRKFFSSTL